MSEWLDNLKVGDKVVIGGGPMAITTVGRLTKTLIITKGGTKFRRRDGTSPGEWTTGFLQEPTQEIVEQIKQGNLASKLRGYDWRSLPLEILVKVYNLLPRKRDT